MNRLLFIPITFCVLLALNGCSIFQNSSVLTEKSYDLSDFTSVEIEDSSSLIIKSGDDYSINITCNENIVNYLVVYVSNGVLYASLSDDTFVSYDFIISVTMPAVEAVKASGSSSISMSGFDVEDLSVSLSGSSSATVDLESAKTVSLSISEASDIKLISDNEAESVSLTCTGASEAVLKNFSTESAEVYISDASEAWIKSSGSISGQVSGVSTLHYSASDISGLTVTETSYIKSF